VVRFTRKNVIGAMDAETHPLWYSSMQ